MTNGSARSPAVFLGDSPVAAGSAVVLTTYFGAPWWPAPANGRVQVGLEEVLRDLSDEFDAHRVEILEEESRGIDTGHAWLMEYGSLSLRDLARLRPREVMDFIDLHLIYEYVASDLSQAFLGSTWCVVRLDPSVLDDGVVVVPALIVPPEVARGRRGSTGA